MSSRVIAEITSKPHRHVTRDIDVLNESYKNLGMPKVGQAPYVHPQNGQTYREFHLSKMQCWDLMTGYNTELRIKVNRRWEELETKAAQQPAVSVADKKLSNMLLDAYTNRSRIENRIPATPIPTNHFSPSKRFPARPAHCIIPR